MTKSTSRNQKGSTSFSNFYPKSYSCENQNTHGHGAVEYAHQARSSHVISSSWQLSLQWQSGFEEELTYMNTSIKSSPTIFIYLLQILLMYPAKDVYSIGWGFTVCCMSVPCIEANSATCIDYWGLEGNFAFSFWRILCWTLDLWIVVPSLRGVWILGVKF